MQKIAARMLIRQFCVHGDDKTGITIMQMDVGLDTGDMLEHRWHPGIDARALTLCALV